MCLALILVTSIVGGLGLLSLLFGGIDFLFGKPRFKILKSLLGSKGLAFSFDFNNAKEPVKFDHIQVRLFNPFSDPTQIEVSKEFAPQDSSFAIDLDMGVGLEQLLSAIGTQNATVCISLSATKDGVMHQYEMKAYKFKVMMNSAEKTAEDSKPGHQVETTTEQVDMSKGMAPRNMVVDTVPGKGDQLFISVNPTFASHFAGGAGGAAAAGDAGPAAENFAVSKVWIEPGCIVCDACEGIYPEVFQVTADTCIIRDNPPLDDGLKIQEAAEACPVEVIKFNKA